MVHPEAGSPGEQDSGGQARDGQDSGERDSAPLETGLSTAIIGAGPVGLVAAAHLLARGQTPAILELGDRPGWSIRRWAHVRLFSPWRYLIDDVAAGLLADVGWVRPDPDRTPTGGEFLERFVDPLGAALSEYLVAPAFVSHIARAGLDVLKSAGRDRAPFEVRYTGADGRQETLMARAVIDASGTYRTPNPLGANGLPARGESLCRRRLHYGVPDTEGADRDRFADRRVAVVGSGHTAANTLLGLRELRRRASGTSVTWVVRGGVADALRGGGEADALAERGKLELALRRAVEGGSIAVAERFRVGGVEPDDGGDVILVSEDGRTLGPFDQVVVATGYRPDLALTRELRLEVDPSVESPRALAPMIDPNVHSCGTVPPHGVAELGHPERDFFTVGMKSYGRAPTFLLLTGYEQVRSVACHLAGDDEGARSVRLELPETGVCVTDPQPTGDDGFAAQPTSDERLAARPIGHEGLAAKPTSDEGCDTRPAADGGCDDAGRGGGSDGARAPGRPPGETVP